MEELRMAVNVPVDVQRGKQVGAHDPVLRARL